MKIYTAAIERSECYGHGDFGLEQRISRMGAYGRLGFPPVFTTREAATRWLLENQEAFLGKAVVVELDLVGEAS